MGKLRNFYEKVTEFLKNRQISVSTDGALFLQHCESLVLGSFHDFALSRTLVVYATEMENAMDNNAMKLIVIVLAEEFGIGAHGIERDYHVAAHDIVLVIVEGNDISVIVMT